MENLDWVYLNGAFVARDEARVSPFDRGYLFAHAAYEVTAVYDGKFVDLDLHIERLRRTLSGIEIEFPDLDLVAAHHELRARNDLSEGLIYLQISAGDQGPRDFYGPETLTPSIFMFSTQKKLIDAVARDGITAISYADTRWQRRDLKTTQLLTQSLAYRAARRAGAFTAILHDEGEMTEAASANLWIVTAEGNLVTRDLSAALLPGITRQRSIDLLHARGLAPQQRAFSLDDLKGAREAFTSSTGALIAPLLKLDETMIGNGAPGPMTRQVQSAYYEYIGADLSAIDFL